MSAHKARIERSNRKGMDQLDIELTVTDTGGGRQSWSGAFMSRSIDGILPDERFSLFLDTGQKGTARVKETEFDSIGHGDAEVEIPRGRGAWSVGA